VVGIRLNWVRRAALRRCIEVEYDTMGKLAKTLKLAPQ